MKLILGSSSKARQELLKRIAPDFEVVVPNIDEKAIRNDDPGELVRLIAEAKSRAVLEKVDYPATIITSDQVVVVNGETREKPSGAEQAREWITTHHLYPNETWAAVHVINTETAQVARGLDVAKIWYDKLPDEVVENLMKQGEWEFSSGGLFVENEMAKDYIIRQEGDLDSVQGLPLEMTYRLLVEVGAGILCLK